ncbi:GNAT family N-acetyltransferase [Mesorhizobium cantuariense]|uniref:GNAT family N-acetyltransferase n=1 Tax=Mesorhizobium cantuariense TaxID=1300275 RepID=A0ABV7MKK3_9HYPH
MRCLCAFEEAEGFCRGCAWQGRWTASLDGSVVRSVFVDPELQGRGIGKRLMAEVEEAAHAGGVSYHGDERTVIMERSLNGPGQRR